MTATKFSGKDLRGLKESDIDDLLSKLSAEELEELHMELVDPDDPHIPPSDRCRYRTDKESSGPYDREKLIEYLEKKAAEETDWQDAKPYMKETRGKVWKPKEPEKVTVGRDEEEVAIETEWDDALENATEEELVDLAAILGFHGMLNQNQYHHAFVSGKQAKDLPGGLQAVTKCEPCKPFEMEQPNSTNIGECMKDLKNNSSSLKELNLNNIKDISDVTLQDLFQALKSNTHLEKLHMANTGITDKSGKLLRDALESNKSLTFLNLESNFLSGTIIIELVRAINKNQTVVDFKVANQRPQVLGVKCEMEIADLLKSNEKILRFGIFLEVPQARNTISKVLQRNNDAIRKERLDKK